MEKRKVVVTGGAGYIGSHTCVLLLQRGFEVVVVDNFCNSKEEAVRRVEALADQKVKVYRTNIQDESALDEVYATEAPVWATIHFAALKAVGESVACPLQYYSNNVGGALSLLRVMEKHECRRLVFSSSATVYGAPERLPVSEDCAVRPTNPYGHTKRMMEQIMEDMCAANKDLTVILLRYFNPIGAHPSGKIGENPNGIPNNLMPFVTQVACGRRETLMVFGDDWPTPDGTGVRDYVHVMDLADAHVVALEKVRTCGASVYNIGTGQGYSVLDLVHGVERACGKAIPYKVVGRRPGDVSTLYADVGKANRELGWKAKLGLDDMCQDSWRWQHQNPNGL